MKKTFLISSLIIFLCQYSFAQTNYAIKLAETIMNTYKDSMVVKKYASHLQQDKQIAPGQTVEQAQLNRPAVWNYEMGVVLAGFEKLAVLQSDKKYADYTKNIIDHFITADGVIRTYDMEEYNLDNIPSGRQLLHLYQTTKEEKYKTAAASLYKQLAWQPRNKIGGYWHKLKYPTQMWLDGLYMAEPFAAEYAAMFNDTKKFDDIVNQFVWMEKYSRDSKTGLLYHGWDESKLQQWANPKTGLSPEFWSRAMGWYMMALVDVLDQLPANYKRRTELIAILNRLSTALIKFQDAKEGVWWQVTDKANKELNYLESSSSAMFVYALSKAVNKNYISKSFVPAITKAYNGVIKNFVVVDKDGNVHYTKAVAGAGLGGTPYRDGTYDYYVKEPKRDDDLKAIGPFIQACIEYEWLIKKK
ncbi:glycoside hydrolase family 88/105 protein [Ferruginibacter sp. SUN106]|uniref:glycoside hydrolase family 88/105 protein n=1 Tax=Ferruginibacter sp. SUN106 TaxID=2978348 RepID=UPI003D3665E6